MTRANEAIAVPYTITQIRWILRHCESIVDWGIVKCGRNCRHLIKLLQSGYHVCSSLIVNICKLARVTCGVLQSQPGCSKSYSERIALRLSWRPCWRPHPMESFAWRIRK